MTVNISAGTITYTRTSTNVKMNRIAMAAAEYLYPHYPVTKLVDGHEQVIPFAELTKGQKESILDKHLTRVLMDAAKTQAVIVAMEAARVTAQAEDLTL